MKMVRLVFCVCLLVVSSVANAGFVKVVVGGEVDFVDPTASGVNVGDPVVGEAIYDESLVGGGGWLHLWTRRSSFPIPCLSGFAVIVRGRFQFYRDG